MKMLLECLRKGKTDMRIKKLIDRVELSVRAAVAKSELVYFLVRMIRNARQLDGLELRSQI